MPRNQWIIVAGLAVITLLLFSRVVGYPFLNFDDTDYVTKNPAVQSGLTVKGVLWALNTTHSSNWHPLTWLSHMLDWELFGPWAGGHHLTNVFLHVGNALLLFFFLKHATERFWPSIIVAALFAWHPLHVESVAWISERKDLLSTLFGLIALLAYTSYARVPRVSRYAIAMGAFMCSLLAKPMLVTLPFLMLLLDYWPLRRMPFDQGMGGGLRTKTKILVTLVLEKIPFLFLSLASCLITFYAQKSGGAVASIERINAGDRIANAVASYAKYLWHTVWPVELAVFYPHPLSVPAADLLLAVAVLVGLSVSVFLARRRYLTVGWFWYLGLLVPVIGIVQVGDQAMADRYTYLPLTGVFIGVVWACEESAGAFPRLKQPIMLVGGAVALALFFCTFWQLSFWSSPERLFTRALQVTKNNYVAHNNLGSFLDSSGRYEAAKWNYLEAFRIRPDFAITRYNLANAFARESNYSEALTHYRAVVALSPTFADAHYNFGVLLATFGDVEKGIEHHRIAIRCRPGFAEANFNLARLLARLGKAEEAVVFYEEALRIRPAWLHARIDFGSVLERLGRNAEAVYQYSEALRQNPSSAHAHSNLGTLLARLGRFESAGKHLSEVVRLEPNNADAHYNLGNFLFEQGQMAEAAFQYREVIRLNPADAKAKEKLDRVAGDMAKRF
jgi:protein O-mannosyl-transferase